MMHELVGRLAQFGGEAALCALFLISILSVGIISERIWHFARRQANVEEFARQLIVLLRAEDLPKGLALTERSNVSVGSITQAALTQAAHGLHAVRQTLDAAAYRERARLQEKLTILKDLARLSLLIGLAGTLFDLLALGAPNGLAPPRIDSSTVTQVYHLVTATLAPAVAGLLVAIPAWLATSMLNVHVQRHLFECDFIARVVSAQLEAQATNPVDSCESSNQAA
jgi:biopolymer transport protein ExbB/TolQ